MSINFGITWMSWNFVSKQPVEGGTHLLNLVNMQNIQWIDIFALGIWNATNLLSITGDPPRKDLVKIVDLVIVRFWNFHFVSRQQDDRFGMIRQVGNYFIKFLRRYSTVAHFLQRWSLFSSQWWKELEKNVWVIIRGKIRNQRLVNQKCLQCHGLLFLVFGKVIVCDNKKWSHSVGASRTCWKRIPILDWLWCIWPNPLIDIFQSPLCSCLHKMFWKLHFFILKFDRIKVGFQLWRIGANWIRNQWIKNIWALNRTLNTTSNFTPACFWDWIISNWSTSNLIDK